MKTIRTIKTRKKVEGIKALDRPANLSKRMKDAYIRTKKQAEETREPSHASPTDYATDNVQRTAQGAVREAAHCPNPVRKASDNIERAKGHFDEVKRQMPKARQDAAEQARQSAVKTRDYADKWKNTAEQAKKTASEAKTAVKDAKQTLKETRQAGRRTMRVVKQRTKVVDSGQVTVDSSGSLNKGVTSTRADDKTVKITANSYGKSPKLSTVNSQLSTGKRPGYMNKGVTATKRTGDTAKSGDKAVKSTKKAIKTTRKGTIKTARKSVKTAEKSAKAAVKTAKTTAKVAQKSAVASAKAAKAAALASKAAAKTAIIAAKIAVKATIATVKAAIAAIKGLVALIAAGGWIAVVIVLIICLIGLFVGSVFGIFFSGEDTGTGRTMPDVVSELTMEFYDRIDEIQRSNPHDILDVAPMSINWPEVLAVYAVKVNTDPNNPTDVVTLDDDRVNILRGVLNDMAILSHHTTYHTEEHTVIGDDGEETTETVTIITLHIILTHRSADEMAVQYGFSGEQIALLHELLSPEHYELWAMLLGGFVPGTGEILTGDPNRNPNGIFSWPLAGSWPVNSGFGNRPNPFNGEPEFHHGIDIAAPAGTPILAAADGIVIVANGTDSWGGGFGFHIQIQHEGGYVTLYAHCSRISVRNGQEVVKGEVIGFVGSTGRSTGPHLHWEIHHNGVRVDPLRYFG